MSKRIYNKIQNIKQEHRINVVRNVIKNRHPELWSDIFTKFPFLNEKASIPEIEYCLLEKLKHRPRCKMCENGVQWHRGAYREFCSIKCSGPSRASRMRDTVLEKYGVSNPSKLSHVKNKKKEASIKKYGVDNVSKSDAIKSKISAKARDRWGKNLKSFVVGLETHPLNMTKKEYYRAVGRITEWMYKQYKNILDPNGTRGRGSHIDHSVSICYGYQNSIQPNIIGDINNLEMLSIRDNTSKQYKNSMTIDELFEKYNLYYLTNKLPPINDKFEVPNTSVITPKAVISEKSGKCKYCDKDSFFINIYGQHQCGETYHTCTNVRLRDESGRFMKRI